MQQSVSLGPEPVPWIKCGSVNAAQIHFESRSNALMEISNDVDEAIRRPPQTTAIACSRVCKSGPQISLLVLAVPDHGEPTGNSGQPASLVREHARDLQNASCNKGSSTPGALPMQVTLAHLRFAAFPSPTSC